jgi:hypothetical protein
MIKVYLLQDEDLEAFLNKNGLAAKSFPSVHALEHGIKSEGLPDVLLSDYNGLNTIEKYKYSIPLILGVTSNFCDANAREKMMVAGCAYVSDKAHKRNVFTSIKYGLKQEEHLWNELNGVK